MRSILFVCTANICRSPTAEGVLKKMLAARGKAARVLGWTARSRVKDVVSQLVG